MADVTLERFRLPNVAPYCTVTTSDWTDSTTGDVLATGDGVTTTFSGKVALPPVNPLDSFVLHYTIGGTAYSVTALADGTISDANVTGTIAQDGTYSLTFSTAPDNATDITADYSYGIAPANLENALDPSNPNPSDWGWKTTTGAGNLGVLVFTLPEEGTYLVCLRSTALRITNNVGGKLSNIYWAYDPTILGWRYTASLNTFNPSVDVTEQEDSLPFFVNSDRFKLVMYLTGAEEFKWRLNKIFIFKLA